MSLASSGPVIGRAAERHKALKCIRLDGVKLDLTFFLGKINQSNMNM